MEIFRIDSYRTNNALSVSKQEILAGKRTFFVSLPQIKKQRPKGRTSWFFLSLIEIAYQVNSI